MLRSQWNRETNHAIVDESRHSSSAGFLSEFGNLQEHKIRKHRECVQHHSKINERTFRRSSECERPGHSSPSWTRSTVVNDQAIKWAKAKACVYADLRSVCWSDETRPRSRRKKMERPSRRSQDVFIMNAWSTLSKPDCFQPSTGPS